MTAETITLSSFLLARIAEDEAAARAATEGPWVEGIKRSGSPGVWRGIEAHSVLAVRVEFGMAGHEPVADASSAADAAHIARHDPARVLAECAAKRTIVDLHAAYPTPQVMVYGTITACSECGSVDDSPVEWPCPTLRTLAAVYSNHPDYREAWKP